MVLCEAVLAYHATVNNTTATLAATGGTSLTIRDGAYGQARIVNALALCSTDDVQNVWVVPSGYKDSAGFLIPCVTRYAATGSFDLEDTKLPVPIPVPPNSALNVYAQSETGANTVVVVWLWVEYSGNGAYIDIVPGQGTTHREIDAGGALTSVVAADGTAITSLQAGVGYQIAGISAVGVNGGTAGVVGPAFVYFKGPAEFNGMLAYVPLPNAGGYVATGEGGYSDFRSAGIKMPKFRAPNTLTPVFWSYTAEQPVGRLILNAERVY